MKFNYSTYYRYDYFKKSDGIKSWKAKRLKFGDAFASIAYAHGISWEQVLEAFPGIGKYGKNENTEYTLQDQFDFIKENKTRTPRKVLEIGAGRFEVTAFLSKLGYDVHVIEPSIGAQRWLRDTGKKFFGEKIRCKLYNDCVSKFADNINFKEIDTVIMVESLEHIQEKHFNEMYQRILSELKKTNGYLVLTNWIDYHPLSVGQGASALEHCRAIDDKLYDSFERDYGKSLYRNGSHICLVAT